VSVVVHVKPLFCKSAIVFEAMGKNRKRKR